MSNSKLVSYTRLSPNYSKRTAKIRKTTPHHTAGVISLVTLGSIFANKARNASSNYGVDNNGKIGMYVEEHNRAWTSSNWRNDNESITIEVANEKVGGNWKVSDKALAGLIALTEDIHRRNNIGLVNYTGNKNGNMTRHNMFASTSCPGPYLQSKLPYVASEVNKRLKGGTPSRDPVKPRDNTRVDGYWGTATTEKLQANLRTIIDGIISGQYPNSITKNISGVSFSNRKGSNVIRALQKKIGARIDGYIGEETVYKLQAYLGTLRDGKISVPSLMVKELQRRLNDGTF